MISRLAAIVAKLPRPRRRGGGWGAARSWLFRAAATAVLAVAGALLGLRLAGPHTTGTALGQISVRVEPALNGHVDAFIPIADWGIRADAFSAPIALHVEPRTVDRQALIRLGAGDRSLLTQAEADAHAAARSALLRALVWAVAGALLLGVGAALAARAVRPALPRRALAMWLLAPPLWATALGFGVLLRTEGTFTPAAFDNPAFYARGAELAQLLSAAENAQQVGNRYSSSVNRALVGYATLLRGAQRIGGGQGTHPALQVSDLHGNTLVLGPLSKLVSGRPVFFVGDFGQSGTRAEAEALVPQVMKLGRRIVAVSGNHDSSLFMRRLAGAGAMVLTDRGRLLANGEVRGPVTRKVAGLRVAGYPDPLEWHGIDPNDPRRVFSFGDLPNGDRRYARAERRIRSWFAGLRPAPEVVLIHENGLAQSLASAVHARWPRRSLLILTGHDHRQHIDRYGRVLVVDAGTAGAGGAFGAGSQSVGAAELYFARSERLPHAVDLIGVEPISAAASAERVITSSAEACERERVRCHRD